MQVLIDSNEFIKGFNCVDCFDFASKNRIGCLVSLESGRTNEFIDQIRISGIKIIGIKIND